MDPSSSNPCGSRVSCLFRIGSYTHANLKKQDFAWRVRFSHHNKEMSASPYPARRHTWSLAYTPWRATRLCALLVRFLHWVVGCTHPHTFQSGKEMQRDFIATSNWTTWHQVTWGSPATNLQPTRQNEWEQGRPCGAKHPNAASELTLFPYLC